MREISAQRITAAVKRLCINANRHLPQDMRGRIEACRGQEDWAPAREILDRIVENYRIAGENERPICQDTGMACVFLQIGQATAAPRWMRGSARATGRATSARAWCGTPWTG